MVALSLSNSKRLSIWLLPPKPIETTLASIQDDIIANHPKHYNLPKFIPHVTLIGGVPISQCCSVEELAGSSHGNVVEEIDDNDDIDEKAAKIVLQRLQHAFQSQCEGIECKFIQERPFAAKIQNNASGETIIKWNQSCISIMERTPSFMNAMKLADNTLYSTTIHPNPNHNNDKNNKGKVERHFREPLYEPHYSFVYGNEAHLIPDTLECPPTFVSSEMALYWTSPATLEGVESWKEVGRICVGERQV